MVKIIRTNKNKIFLNLLVHNLRHVTSRVNLPVTSSDCLASTLSNPKFLTLIGLFGNNRNTVPL